MEATVVGATGLCASAFIKQALLSSEITNLYALSRRPLNLENAKLKAVATSDIREWETKMPEGKTSSVFFSGIATTRAAAGSLEKQKEIDLDLQVRLAKSAKSKGYTAFVLVSSLGASPTSYFAYLKLKGEIEEAIKAIGFDRTLILRPGGLLGREENHRGFGEGLVTTIMPIFYRSACQRLVGCPTHAEDVAKAALKWAESDTKGVTVLGGKDLLDYVA